MTSTEGMVRGPKGEDVVEFLIDSGARYTLLPIDVWQKIGLKPTRPESFSLVDGTRIERNMSECYIVLPEGETR